MATMGMVMVPIVVLAWVMAKLVVMGFYVLPIVFHSCKTNSAPSPISHLKSSVIILNGF